MKKQKLDLENAFTNNDKCIECIMCLVLPFMPEVCLLELLVFQPE